MQNKIDFPRILPLTALALYSCGVLASFTLDAFDSNRELKQPISLKAQYYGPPALAPMTPGMNPNPNMYFQGGQMGAQMGGGYGQQMPPQYAGPQQGMYPPMNGGMQGGYPGGGMDPYMMQGGQMGGQMGGGRGFGNVGGLDPNDPVQQALSLHQAGRYADAIQIYESIIINNPPDPRIYASIADAHFRLGNGNRALKYAVEALKLDPNYSSGHLLLGTILGDMGDFVRAIRSYERVISLDQNNPYAYYNLGLIYYKKSDIKTAIELLERAKDLNPNDPKIWNNLGVAYYDNGRFAQASAAYSQALAMDPMYEAAKKNLELVRGKMPAPVYQATRKKAVRKGTRKKASSKKVVKKKVD
ncbi:MAG: tetratricopeptide repeat protein [Candidatus Caenarcaniphilales bacterium]|nr:tetratricopeptide repeat protein [Candidatus Caenarcaniphilales bacterium]